MAIFNFRDLDPELFGHIDGELAGYSLSHPDGPCELRVRFYPSWLHPRAKQWREGERRLAFNFPDEARKTFIVYPKEVLSASLFPGSQVIDCAFLEYEEPTRQVTRELWGYQDLSDIMVASALGPEQLERVRALVEPQGLGEHPALIRMARYGAKPPFSLGQLPFTPYWILREALEAIGASLFLSREPSWRRLPILFKADDSFIVAQDFLVDAPEVIHLPEWVA